jgi:hypothetical protein
MSKNLYKGYFLNQSFSIINPLFKNPDGQAKLHSNTNN